jgi:hypothetical protein
MIALKGREGSVACVTIEAHANVATRFEARSRQGLAPFVGRTRELAALDRQLGDALGGAPRLVAVSAGAGLGKTRLVEEFLRRAGERHCHILRACCEGYLGAEPLHPFLQILAEVFGLRHDLPAADAAATVDRALTQIDPALLALRPELLRALSIGSSGPEPREPRRAGAPSARCCCSSTTGNGPTTRRTRS